MQHTRTVIDPTPLNPAERELRYAKQRLEVAEQTVQTARLEYQLALVDYVVAKARDLGGQSDVLLTAEQVAQRIGWNTSTVRARMASGELPSINLGRSRRVRQTDLDEWIRRQ